MHAYRTHTCGELSKAHVGQSVRLSGWVHRVRDHGGILFIDLRDHYGITQVLADPDSPVFAEVERFRAEWVVRIDGEVRARAPELVNPKLATGEIEVYMREVEVLSQAEELPLPVFGEPEYPEDIRLAYRFLDLRRDGLHRRIMLRSEVIAAIRRRMMAQGFTEFQTPILTASSPEGARDFLVPSRLHPGKFYALPQAPQQFKQLVMVSGFDRYFQIAPCFRDEDPRADRSPGEFYQLDMEMSFVEQEDVFDAIEPVLAETFAEFAGFGRETPWKVTSGGTEIDTTKPQGERHAFLRIPYTEAMEKYGTDKPDLRNPIEMREVSEHFRDSGFQVFAKILERQGTEIRAIPAPTGGSRAFCDRMNSWAQKEGLPGMGYIFWRERQFFDREKIKNWLTVSSEDLEKIGGLSDKDTRDFGLSQLKKALEANDHDRADFIKDAYFGRHEAAGPLARNIGPERAEAIRRKLGLNAGDAAFFLAGTPKSFIDVAARARNVIAEELGLVAHDRFDFCWVVDFPMFEWNEEEERIDFSHNPFSMPQGGLEALENEHPLAIRGLQYDIVCNGVELSSGAIRNHRPDIMYKAFEIAGYPREEVERRFGGMLNAFRYGAPPHGGIAPGIDRIVMLLAGVSNIREVIMFPMNQRAEDLLMQAPSEVSPKQLRELNIRVVPQE